MTTEKKKKQPHRVSRVTKNSLNTNKETITTIQIMQNNQKTMIIVRQTMIKTGQKPPLSQ